MAVKVLPYTIILYNKHFLVLWGLYRQSESAFIYVSTEVSAWASAVLQHCIKPEARRKTKIIYNFGISE